MSDNVPPDVWVEILHRLPLKSLVRWTSVSKDWKSLITDRAFIWGHLTHTIQASNRNPPLLLQLDTKTKYLPGYSSIDKFHSLYSDNEETDRLSISRFPLPHQLQLFGESAVVGTCNGLVCLAQHSVFNEPTQIIWNPSVRKYVVLPKHSVESNQRYVMDGWYEVTYGFGFDSRNKDFKLIRILTIVREDLWEKAAPLIDIYSLASGSWRSVAAKPPPLFVFKHLWDVQRTPHVFMNGVLHWVVNRRSNGQIHNFILTFDVSEETFGELKLPQCLKESHLESRFLVSILAGGNSLAVLHRNGPVSEFFDIWVMKEYGKVESWTRVFQSDSTEYGGISRVLALRRRGEVVLNALTNDIVLLDPMTELVKKLELRPVFTAFVGNHDPSLFLINEVPHVLSY